jgi:hypothetical protein
MSFSSVLAIAVQLHTRVTIAKRTSRDSIYKLVLVLILRTHFRCVFQVGNGGPDRLSAQSTPLALPKASMAMEWTITIIGSRLRARKFANQKAEAALACDILNGMLSCARPESGRVKEATV